MSYITFSSGFSGIAGINVIIFKIEKYIIETVFDYLIMIKGALKRFFHMPRT